MAIITISRLTGSGGREIATAIAEILNFELIDRGRRDAVIEQHFPVGPDTLAKIKADPKMRDEMFRSAIAEVASKQNVVILGSGGQFLFFKVAASLHVQIVAPLADR